VQVLATPQAALAMQQMQDKLDDDFNDETREPHDRALWNRAGLNIKRVAALIAVGCMPSASATPTVEVAHVHWAYEVVEYCVDGLAHKFREGVVGTGEARQEGEMKKYVAEFFDMSPQQRRAYKVPHALCENTGCIGVDYLRRRARSCSAFTQDRRGLNTSLNLTLAALCQSGYLMKVPPQQVLERFGLRGEVYARAKG
jgi:hypothetical protein